MNLKTVFVLILIILTIQAKCPTCGDTIPIEFCYLECEIKNLKSDPAIVPIDEMNVAQSDIITEKYFYNLDITNLFFINLKVFTIHPDAFKNSDGIEYITFKNTTFNSDFSISPPKYRIKSISMIDNLDWLIFNFVQKLIPIQIVLVNMNISYFNLTNFRNLTIFKLINFRNSKLILDLNQNLPILNISHSNITDIQINSYSSDLVMVDLSWNSIEKIQFKNATSLKHLFLSYNSLNSISNKTFESLQNIENLKLNFNLITNIDENFLENFTKLQFLEIKKNKLEGLIKLGFSDSILKLNLKNNQIENLIFNGTELISLCLENNKIQNLSELRTKKLKELNLKNNSITFFPKLKLTSAGTIQNFDLSFNLIESISFFNLEPFESISVLNLSFNRIIQIEFPFLKFLKYLDLSHNKLNWIRNSTFENLPNLSKLNLASNFIYQIDLHSFKSNLLMSELILSNNFLSSLPDVSNSKLELDFLNNSIKAILPHYFCAFRDLKELIFKIDNLDILNKCMLLNFQKISVSIFTQKLTDCSVKLMALKLGFKLEDKSKLNCENFNLINDCSIPSNLKYNCNYKFENLTRKTTWIINNKTLTLKAGLKDLDTKKNNECFMSDYFRLLCEINQNGFLSELILKFKHSRFNLKKSVTNKTKILRQFKVVEYSNGSRMFFHVKSEIYFFIFYRNSQFDLILSASQNIYDKCSGILINGSGEETGDLFSSCSRFFSRLGKM